MAGPGTLQLPDSPLRPHFVEIEKRIPAQGAVLARPQPPRRSAGPIASPPSPAATRENWAVVQAEGLDLLSAKAHRAAVDGVVDLGDRFAHLGPPAFYLDFRDLYAKRSWHAPYQSIPFQWSLQIVGRAPRYSRAVRHREFAGPSTDLRRPLGRAAAPRLGRQ